MPGFWSYVVFSGDGLINIKNVNVAWFFPSSCEEVNADYSVGRDGNANGGSPYSIITSRPNHSLDKLGCLASWHGHSLDTSTCRILPQKNAFQNK